MLRYAEELHRRCVRPPTPPFPHPWEEIGPGYCCGPAFGHWDIVHAILDALHFDADHARRQIENNLATQEDDGLLPGPLCLRDGQITWSRETGHPPVWPLAVQDYIDRNGTDIRPACHEALLRQIKWFEQNRKAEDSGFYYSDILTKRWESGVDEGIRFLNAPSGASACIDATAHVYAMYLYASRWGEALGEDSRYYRQKAESLEAFIQEKLFSEETGFFHDAWAIHEPALRCFALEGMWPLVVGAATTEQAHRVIEEHLTNTERFFCKHPLATVSQDDPRFELRMWRGPAWNSMTYWAARGCMTYNAFSAAAAILEAALDDSAAQFERTGTLWEFYHPFGGRPEDVERKPQTEFNQPCRDYAGHNPLLAMAHLYDNARQGQKT